MIVKKLLWIGVLLFLLALPFVSADLESETTSYFTLDIDNATQYSVVSGDGISGTVSAAVFNAAGFIINASYTYDGTSDSINIDEDALDVTEASDYSISFWLNDTDALDRHTPFNMQSTGDGYNINVNTNLVTVRSLTFSGTKTGTTYFTAATSTIIVDSAKHHIVLIQDSVAGFAYVFVDKVLRAKDALVNLGDPADPSNGAIAFGRNHATYSWQGDLDELAIFEGTAITHGTTNVGDNATGQVAELFADGAGNQYPYAAAPAVNDSNFSTIQTGAFSFNEPVSIGAAFGVVNSITFEGDNNESPFYFSSSFSTNASVVSTSVCRILVDGVESATGTRSLSAGTMGNFVLITQPENLSLDNHTITTECQKTSGGNYIIQNSQLTSFHLHDTITNTSVPFMSLNASTLPLNVTNRSIASFTWTTGNITNTTNVNTLVLHGRASFSYTSATNISLTVRNEETGETCGEYTRYGAIGSIGSGGTMCLFRNLNSTTTYNISVYAHTDVGVGSIDDLLINAYELQTNETATNSTKLLFSVPAGVETNVSNITITNVLGGSYNTFVGSGIMVTGNATQNAYFRLDNAGESIKFHRTLDDNGNANINPQFVFSESGTGIKQYYLTAFCPLGCEITSGDLTAFVSDAESVSTGVFNVTAFNFYNSTPILTFNVTIGGSTLFTTNGTVTAIGQGNINVLVEAENFFSNTTLHDTTTDFNASLVKYVEIRANEFGGGAIVNFSVNSSTDSFTTTNGVAYLPILVSTNVTFNSTTHAITTEVVSLAQFFNFSAFSINSILFSIFDFETSILINQSVDIDLVSSLISYNFSTSNGTFYAEELIDGTYTATFSSVNFSNTVLFLTISNEVHLDVDVFMQSNLNAVDFIVKDSNLVPIDGAVLTFSTVINGTTIVIIQGETDFSGRAQVLLNENLSYTFTTVKTGFDVFAGTINPTEEEYSITMISSASSDFITMFDDVTYTPVFTYFIGAVSANASFLVNSVDGSLEYFGLTSTYENVTFTENITTIPGGGFPSINITGISNSTSLTVNVTYFFKSVGHDEFFFTEVYILSRINGSTISITGGLFDDLINVPDSLPVKPIVGMMIVIFLIAVFLGSTRNLSVGVFGGLIGAGLNWQLALWSPTMTLITIILGIIFIVADNVR